MQNKSLIFIIFLVLTLSLTSIYLYKKSSVIFNKLYHHNQQHNSASEQNGKMQSLSIASTSLNLKENKNNPLNLNSTKSTKTLQTAPPLFQTFHNSARKIQKENSQILNKLNKQDHQGEWKWNQNRFGLTTFMEGITPIRVDNVDAATEFMQNIFQNTKLAQQLQLSQEETHDIPSKSEDYVYHWDQTIGTLKIFNSYVKIFGRTEDGFVYFILKNTKNIVSINKTITVSSDQARNIIETQYPSVNQITVQPINEVYVNEDNTAELSWRCTLLRNNLDRRLILISALSGNILYDQSLVKN